MQFSVSSLSESCIKMLCKHSEPTKAALQVLDTPQSLLLCIPIRWTRERGRPWAVPKAFHRKKVRKGILGLEYLAAFGVSGKGYDQDRQARQSLALRKALTRILPTSFSPSRVYLPAQSNLKIIKEDIQEDRRAAKELVSLKKGLRGSYQTHAPPSPPQASLSTKNQRLF